MLAPMENKTTFVKLALTFKIFRMSDPGMKIR
jgi:hypothetical protein